jgi:short-subunit dehydrogenase
MNHFQGKSVLLTGGSRGIGPFIADAFARAGADVILTARSEAKLLAVAKRLRDLGSRTAVIAGDLTNPEQRDEVAEKAVRRPGGVDILVNNAGVESEGAFADQAWDLAAAMLDLNLYAPMALTHRLLPHMIERGSGHIVNIASLAAKGGPPYDAVYSGTKAGLAEWSRSLRVEMASSGIGCSTVFPGYVTDHGMFARHHLSPPRLIGSCTPGQVADAVLMAIRDDRPEVIVNSMPLRPLIALGELWPRLGEWILRRSGVVAFQRLKAGR